MPSTDSTSRSGADRILDAAISLFGKHGFRGTTLKDIASEADVSQALIIHHYGTKEALRASCDEHVAQGIRARKEETLADESQFDPFKALRQMGNSRDLFRYLTRTMTEGGDHAAQLLDDMIADAQDYIADGVQAGLIKPSAVPRDRVVLLVLWSAGALILHEQARRLLGVDFLAEDLSPEALQRYLYPAMELYTQGLVEDGALDGLTTILAARAEQPNTDDDAEQ